MAKGLGIAYWTVVGTLVVAGTFTSAVYDLPPYSLPVALTMAIFGAWRPGLRYSWAASFGLLTLPAVALSSSLLEQVVRSDWSCSEVSFRPGESVGYSDPSGGEVLCATIPGQLVVASAVFWAIPLIGVAVLLYFLRGSRADSPEDRPGTPGGETTVDLAGIFVRAVAVLVGLANLTVLAVLNGIDGAIRRGDVTWGSALPVVLAVVIAGLATSEVFLRWFRPSILARRFADRYGAVVLVVCLGGTLTGFLLAFALTLERALVPGPPGVPELILVAFLPGLVGAAFGLGLGLAEGMVLALPLAAVLGKFRQTQGQERGASLPGVALLGLLMVAAITSYAAAPPPPPEAETADLSDNPPISCQRGMEEIGYFEGPGDQVTPAFETIGDEWGYEFSSAGPGSLRVMVLDEDGNEVEGSEERISGGSVGGAGFASSGTFSLKVDAEDDVEYRVLVCDETHPSGRNRGGISR